MYAVDGGRDLPERELTTCPATPTRGPVRIGNGAVISARATCSAR